MPATKPGEWCPKCGVGNEGAGYTHLPNCRVNIGTVVAEINLRPDGVNVHVLTRNVSQAAGVPLEVAGDAVQLALEKGVVVEDQNGRIVLYHPPKRMPQ